MPVLKTGDLARGPRVQISPPPPSPCITPFSSPSPFISAPGTHTSAVQGLRPILGTSTSDAYRFTLAYTHTPAPRLPRTVSLDVELPEPGPSPFPSIHLGTHSFIAIQASYILPTTHFSRRLSFQQLPPFRSAPPTSTVFSKILRCPNMAPISMPLGESLPGEETDAQTNWENRGYSTGTRRQSLPLLRRS